MTDISRHIETVARHFWGEPTHSLSTDQALRFGANGSKVVELDTGVFFDFERDQGGGVADLIRLEKQLDDGAPVAPVLDEIVGDGIRNFAAYLGNAKPITYDYKDADGQLRYQVLRYHPKKIRQRRPFGDDGWKYNLKGVESLPYNLPALLARNSDPVYIVEGEKCADALIRRGFLATTNSGGAGKWRPELNSWFKDRRIYLLADNDEAGQRHAEKVIAALWPVAKSIHQVRLPDLPLKGDVVDWFDGGRSSDQFLREVERAELITNPPVIDARYDEVAEQVRLLSLEALRKLPPPEWLIDGVLTKQGLAVMYGAPGSCKSFMAIDMALAVAAGRRWHGHKVAQGPVIYIAAEGVAGLANRVTAWERYFNVPLEAAPFYIVPEVVNLRSAEDLDRLLEAVEVPEEGFSMIVIDTVARSLAGGDENSAADMGLFVSACETISRRLGCAVLAIHHSGKDPSRGMRGSSALLGAVDTSLSVTKHDGVVTLKMEKQKDAEEIQPVSFSVTPIEIDSRRSSLVLSYVGRGEAAKRQVKLSARQYAALQALRNLLIDASPRNVTLSDWHDAHARKSPDLTPSQRKDARQGLQDKGLVVVDSGRAWINGDVEKRLHTPPEAKTGPLTFMEMALNPRELDDGGLDFPF